MPAGYDNFCEYSGFSEFALGIKIFLKYWSVRFSDTWLKARPRAQFGGPGF